MIFQGRGHFPNSVYVFTFLQLLDQFGHIMLIIFVHLWTGLTKIVKEISQTYSKKIQTDQNLAEMLINWYRIAKK